MWSVHLIELIDLKKDLEKAQYVQPADSGAFGILHGHIQSLKWDQPADVEFWIIMQWKYAFHVQTPIQNEKYFIKWCVTVSASI